MFAGVVCNSSLTLRTFNVLMMAEACAVLANDEETCVSACRYFMKDYQFTTDTYRMFAALTRLCQSPISWYSSGPTQKYILRQIKAMDFGLVNDDARQRYFSEKGSYSAQDESGRLIVNKDMDIALLMVYGHILYTGTSYAYALSRFTMPARGAFFHTDGGQIISSEHTP